MQAQAPKKTSRRMRVFLRRALLVMALLLIVILLFLGVLLRRDLYLRFVRFPRQARAWAALEAQRQEVTLDDGWTEFRGAIHCHSHLSHDSMVSFEEILAALKETDSDFVFLADHCVEGVADFAWQWRGLKDGILFIPGFEMNHGFMPFGVDASVRLDNNTPAQALARQVVDNGGILTYAHAEQMRDWTIPEVVAMDIYNTHADAKDEDLEQLRFSLLLSLGSYPDQAVRMIFDPPHAQLATWDRLNRDRKMVGFASNDCHQNQGLKGYYTQDRHLRIDDTSPETVARVKLNTVTRTLLRLLPGPLEPDKQLFHLQLDPYPRMIRYVRNHILARELTEQSLLTSFKQGRVFISFSLMADARGFVWMAQHGDKRAVMGESLPYAGDVTLRAAAPQACRFIIVKDGQQVYRAQGRSLDWQPPGPGKYRVQAELFVLDEWLPWVYTNPIELYRLQ